MKLTYTALFTLLVGCSSVDLQDATDVVFPPPTLLRFNGEWNQDSRNAVAIACNKWSSILKSKCEIYSAGDFNTSRDVDVYWGVDVSTDPVKENDIVSKWHADDIPGEKKIIISNAVQNPRDIQRIAMHTIGYVLGNMSSDTIQCAAIASNPTSAKCWENLTTYDFELCRSKHKC